MGGSFFVRSFATLAPLLACHRIVGIDEPRFVDSGMTSKADAAAPTAANVSAQCRDGDLTARAEPTDAPTELVALAHYTSEIRDATPAHTQITVTRTKPIVLALYTYDPTEWRISVSPASTVERVVTYGGPSTVVGLAQGVAIEARVYSESDTTPAPHDPNGIATFAATIAPELGVGLGAYAGCYESSSFTVADR